MRTKTGPRWVGVIVGVLVAASVFVPASVGSAQLSPTVADLPTSVVPPPEGNGVPFVLNQFGSLGGVSVDLAEFRYVEEEFLVSGEANVYRYGATGAVEVQTEDVPYTARVVVRRPENPHRFSGNVHAQWGGLSSDLLFWAADYVFRNGDVWVNIFTSGLPGGVETVQTFDPVRYADLNFPEFGLTWDVLGEVGRLLKTQIPANPLHGYDVEKVYVNGWSGSAAPWLLHYIGDGFHERVRMPDGGPIFDGYLLGEPSSAGRLNSTAPAIPTNDERQQAGPVDVPVIALHTRPQEPYRRRSDGDAPDDLYRAYEVAGAAHANPRAARAYNQPADAFLIGGPFGCVREVSRFPLTFYFQSTLARIDAWARGVTPPPSQPLELNPDGTVKLDEHGNPLGGVRSSYRDVPTVRYFANASASGGISICGFSGAQEHFSAEKLVSLYRNHGGYVSRAIRRINELEREGWLLRADAHELRVEAARFDGI